MTARTRRGGRRSTRRRCAPALSSIRFEPVTDLLEEVRVATRALSGLVAQASALWPKVSVALSATCDDVERRLAEKQLTAVVAGAESKRVLETALGRPLFEGRLPQRAAVFVRHADEPGFVA